MSTILERTVTNPEETARFAGALAAYLETGDILLLKGPLGAGKSHFARALIRAALNRPEEEVPSPTFTLVQTYERGDGPGLWHFDLYRLEDAGEIYELGMEEAFDTGISLIEWPERMGKALPDQALLITIGVGKKEGVRHIAVKGSGMWAERLKACETGEA